MSFDVISSCHRFFDAVERGDASAMRHEVTPTAVVWHNFDDAEKPFESLISTLLAAKAVLSQPRYEERRYEAMPGGAVLQHRLVGEAGGQKLNMPIIIRVLTKDTGLDRFEEYFDPAAVRFVQPAIGKRGRNVRDGAVRVGDRL